MADETPELTPEEQAANDAHTAVNEADATWGEKIEARLRALEDAAGLTTADEAETTEEDK